MKPHCKKKETHPWTKINLENLVKYFCVLLTGFKLGSWNVKPDALPIEPPRHPQNGLEEMCFIYLFVFLMTCTDAGVPCSFTAFAAGWRLEQGGRHKASDGRDYQATWSA